MLSRSFFIIFLCIPFLALTQNTFPSSGNVGIGTTSPSSRLELANLGGYDGILLDSIFKMRTSAATSSHFVLENLTSSGSIYIRVGRQGGALVLNDNNGGRVGIGTASPTEILDVRGKTKIKNALIIDGIEIGNPTAKEEQVRLSGYGLLGNRENFYISNEHSQGQINLYAGGRHGTGSHLVIKHTGNVGIGTRNPDAKLAVNGNIHTQEVKVDLNGAVAPDYVFDVNYNLLTLEQVQEFINKNGHLPRVPSAKEMNEEGINLKEMNLKLLEKIEELTLYVLKQDERINILEGQISK